MVVGIVGFVGARALQAPALPSGAALLTLAGCATPTVLGLVAPLACVVGLSGTLRRWRQEGQWTAVQAAGLGGRVLLGPALGFALAVGGLCWVSAHHLEPAARAAARGLVTEALRPRPGVPLQIGTVTLLADAVDASGLTGVFFAVDGPTWPRVGSARAASLAPGQLLLESGVVHLPGPPQARVDFERLTLPLPVPDHRVELNERSDAALAALIARMEARGRDAGYERAVLLKRSAWPVAAALLVLICPPLALRRRALWPAVPIVAYWGLVRGLDAGARAVGGGVAAWLPVALLGLAVAWTWGRWRER